jgi:ABC-type antimicrobial peptide transport system permease subunit
VKSLDIGPLSASTLSSGRAFTTDDATANVALISDTYANQKGLALDGTITVAGTPLSIVGIVSSTGATSTDVFIPLGTAQTLASQTDKVSTIYVQASSAGDVDTAKSEIQAALPGTTVTTTSDLASQISGSLSSAASLANNLGKWLSILVLIAAFAVAALFTISGVSRRMRELGTLKALGWRGRRIIGQIAGESLVQGALGGVAGILLGLLGARMVASLAPPLTASVASGFGGNGAGGTGRFGGAGAYGANAAAGQAPGGVAGGPNAAFRAASAISVHLTAPVTLSAIGLAVGLAVAGGLIAGAFGGWRASRLRPADALRRID